MYVRVRMWHKFQDTKISRKTEFLTEFLWCSFDLRAIWHQMPPTNSSYVSATAAATGGIIFHLSAIVDEA